MKTRARAEAQTDGCTLAPDLFCLACCIQHDADYITRADEHGNPLTRQQADARLRDCIANTRPTIAPAAPFCAWLYWSAVRLFGWIWWNRYKAKT